MFYAGASVRSKNLVDVQLTLAADIFEQKYTRMSSVIFIEVSKYKMLQLQATRL
jgi:hypothetical protein